MKSLSSLVLWLDVLCFQLMMVVPLTNADSQQSLYQKLQCSICQLEELRGSISDCKCHYESVNYAVENFFIPHLRNITSRSRTNHGLPDHQHNFLL
jgi:hypothetical protein